MSRHAALFDLDGVLVDTEGIYYTFWDNIEKIYPTGINDFATFIKGSTLKKILTYYTDDEVRRKVIAKLEEHEAQMRYVIFDGVYEFLEQLKDEGIPCAIVTSSNDDKLAKLFAQNPGFKDYFDVVITDSRVSRSKPDPQGYLLAAESLNCHPEDCFVFEDSYSGLEAGRRSGAKVIGLTTTNPREGVARLSDMVIGSFNELTVNKLISLFAVAVEA